MSQKIQQDSYCSAFYQHFVCCKNDAMKHHQNILKVHSWCCSHASPHAHGVAQTQTGIVECCQRQALCFSPVFPRVVHIQFNLKSTIEHTCLLPSTVSFLLNYKGKCPSRASIFSNYTDVENQRKNDGLFLCPHGQRGEQNSPKAFLTSLFVSSQSDGTFAVHEARTQSSESTILPHTHPSGLFLSTMTSLYQCMQRWPSCHFAEHDSGCSFH